MNSHLAKIIFWVAVFVNNKNDKKIPIKQFINNKIKVEKIVIYPNAFESKITIGNLLINQEVLISISTIDQKLILHQNGKFNGSGTYRLQLDGLPPGIYFLNIVSENMNFQGRFIVEQVKALK